MLTVGFGTGTPYRRVAAMTFSFMGESKIGCTGIGCANADVVRLDFSAELIRTGRLLITRELEQEAAERQCVQAVEAALQSEISSASSAGSRNWPTDGDAHPPGGAPNTSYPMLHLPVGIRLSVDGEEQLRVADLNQFDYVHITAGIRARDLRLALIAQGTERGAPGQRHTWVRRELPGRVVLLIEHV